MANFLWGKTEFGVKFHWLSWDSCCFPFDEGGLKFRSFHSLLDAFTAKLIWKLNKNDSIWAHYIQNKYYKNIALVDSCCNNTSSHVWKRIHNLIPKVMELILIGNGTMHWIPSANGIFTTSSAWESLRNRKPKCNFANFIWNKQIPNKISFFMWRLLQNRLPTDDNICRFGICMVSKCRCCNQQKQETISHLFAKSEAAQTTWKFFAAAVGLNFHLHSLSGILNSWWRQKAPGKPHKFFYRALPAIICWELWKARNLSMYEGCEMNCDRIIFRILQSLRLQARAYTFHAKGKLAEICNDLQIKSQNSGKYRARWDTWSSSNCPKINFAFDYEQCKYAGIIRSAQGIYVTGFGKMIKGASPYNLVIQAIKHATAHRQLFEVMETDNHFACDTYGMKNQVSDFIQNELEVCILMLCNKDFKTCSTMSNAAAQSLLKATTSDHIWPDINTLPRFTRGLIFTDGIGLPHVHI